MIKFNVDVLAKVSKTDLNNIFNYESYDHYQSEMVITAPGVIVGDEKSASFFEGTFSYDPKLQLIANAVVAEEENFVLKFEGSKTSNKDIDSKPWLIIRHTDFSNKYGAKMKKGDIVRLGKVTFKVLELKSQKLSKEESMKVEELSEDKGNRTISDKDDDEAIDDIQNNFNNVLESEDFANHNNDQLKLGDKIKYEAKIRNGNTCRVCLSENEDDNPLISPCHCTGSVRYIHLECLRHWIKSKVTTKTLNFLIVHIFKSLECEICKVDIPDIVKVKGKIVNLVELKTPDTNFMMLESVNRHKHESRFIYIINMNEKRTVSLGRANSSDIRMTDISVSRHHSNIHLAGGQFYIEDKASKFGTMIMLKVDLGLLPRKAIAVQAGKYWFNFYMDNSFWASFCCYNGKQLNNYTYNSLIEKYSKDASKLKTSDDIIGDFYNLSDIKECLDEDELSAYEETKRNNEDRVGEIEGARFKNTEEIQNNSQDANTVMNNNLNHSGILIKKKITNHIESITRDYNNETDKTKHDEELYNLIRMQKNSVNAARGGGTANVNANANIEASNQNLLGRNNANASASATKEDSPYTFAYRGKVVSEQEKQKLKNIQEVNNSVASIENINLNKNSQMQEVNEKYLEDSGKKNNYIMDQNIRGLELKDSPSKRKKGDTNTNTNTNNQSNAFYNDKEPVNSSASPIKEIKEVNQPKQLKIRLEDMN